MYQCLILLLRIVYVDLISSVKKKKRPVLCDRSSSTPLFPVRFPPNSTLRIINVTLIVSILPLPTDPFSFPAPDATLPPFSYFFLRARADGSICARLHGFVISVCHTLLSSLSYEVQPRGHPVVATLCMLV